MRHKKWGRNNATIAGPVHVNGDVYLNPDGTVTFTTDTFRCCGELIRQSKHEDGFAGGHVLFRRKGTDSFQEISFGQASAERWIGGKCSPTAYS